jgi:hypothetical protein
MRRNITYQQQSSRRDSGGAQKQVRGYGQGFKKTADLVGSAIIKALNPLKARVKTLTYDNGKDFSGHARID